MADVTSSYNEIKIDGDNNKVYIGSKEIFEPMMKWMEEKIHLNIKSVGKRYAPNNMKYEFLNQHLDIENIFNYFSHDFIYTRIINMITDYSYSIVNNSTHNYKSFDNSGATYNFVKEHSLVSFSKNEILEFFEKIIKIIKKEKNDIQNSIQLANQLSDEYYDMTCDPYASYVPDTHLRYEVDQDINNNKANYQKLELLEKQFLSEISLYEKSILLIKGEALIGKTHLFCDVALNRIQNNQPTLLFFGNQFDSSKTIVENMISNLGLKPISDDDFLEALDKWGQEYNTRTLIMIDALNETENSKIWQDGIIKFCEQIKSYPNLALAMSIRDVEKNKIITPENEAYIAEEIVEVEHKGFEGMEIEAVRTFCEALNVEFPKVPLHTYRLFVNPGMLFLYIESIKNSTQKVDTSIINPLTIFNSYVEDLERKYYQKYMGEIDEEDETVREAIREFIALDIKQDFIHFYLDYKEVKKQLKPLHNKVLEFLISEGVLNKLKSDDSTKVYFTYQKFENFFIADYLLGDYETNKDIIFKLIKEYNGAITEALLMQIPEVLGKEIFDLNVWFIRDQYICEQYINSLVWRKPSTIDENTFRYINFILGYENLQDVFLDTVLQLSTIPHHPLNMIRLHKKLLKFSMPDRDYNWSIYLHSSYREDGIVKRIIHWAWDKKEEFEIEDESLYLYGLTLGWFLTSSNRELRDGATKALVNLFTDRVGVFLRVLKEFETVDDLYVLERLYAVGYGIVLRSSVENGFKELGEYLYETIFNQSEVIEHSFIRDYTRLTIDYVSKIYQLQIDKSKIEPPYNQHQNWEIPNIEKDPVKKYVDDYSRLYRSSLYGDFKIYIVYPLLNHFMKFQIKDRPHPKMPKVRHDEFFDTLTQEQKEAYEKTKLSPDKILSQLMNVYKEEIPIEDTESDVQDVSLELRENNNIFKNLLSTEQRKEYDEFIIQYKQKKRYDDGINVQYVKRLIFLEAIKLGWDKELFEEFDRYANNGRRRETGTERIGKKYQWIALYKVLSRLADNYEFREDGHGEKIIDYRGMYQFSHNRDIDPSTILKSKTISDERLFDIDTKFENLKLDDKEWMNSTHKLPTIKQLVNTQEEDKEFLTLHLSFSNDGTKTEKNYRNLYYHIDAFVLKKDCIQNFVEWLGTVNYYGQSKLPQANRLDGMYLREYPNSEAFNHLDIAYYGQVDWEDSFGDMGESMPCKILLTSTSYMNEGQSYDKSVEETIEVSLPHKWFVNEMELKQTLVDGEWKNIQDEVVFFDPTINTGNTSPYNENGTLVADKKLLMSFLESKGYGLVWVMWGEKQVRSSGDGFNNEEFLGIAEISGYGYFDGDEFVEDIKIEYNNE